MATKHEIRDEPKEVELLAIERGRIAAGLHDEIGQRLFMIGVQLGTLLDDDLAPETAARVDHIRRLTAQTAAELRAAIFSLDGGQPSAVDLAESVRRLVEESAAFGLEGDLVVTGTPTSPVARVQPVVHAVVKQALANIVRHAQAARVLVSIRYEPDCVAVVIQDDGIGAPDAVLDAARLDGTRGGHLQFGLRNMRRQIGALGGTLEVANGDECGLAVRVRVPLRISV